MSDTTVVNTSVTVNTKPLGFFRDPSGDLSSGRLVKIGSFFAAIVIGLAGLGVLSYAAIYPAATVNAALTPLSSYCLGIAGMFLGVAGGSEIVQKVTKS